MVHGQSLIGKRREPTPILDESHSRTARRLVPESRLTWPLFFFSHSLSFSFSNSLWSLSFLSIYLSFRVLGSVVGCGLGHSTWPRKLRILEDGLERGRMRCGGLEEDRKHLRPQVNVPWPIDGFGGLRGSESE